MNGHVPVPPYPHPVYPLSLSLNSAVRAAAMMHHEMKRQSGRVSGRWSLICGPIIVSIFIELTKMLKNHVKTTQDGALHGTPSIT